MHCKRERELRAAAAGSNKTAARRGRGGICAFSDYSVVGLLYMALSSCRCGCRKEYCMRCKVVMTIVCISVYVEINIKPVLD